MVRGSDRPADASRPAPRRGLEVRLRQDRPIGLDVELACAPGEVLALVGPSGTGKSTVLRCIAGLHRPRHGFVACGDEVWLDTERGVHRPVQQRRVGFVFQHYALFPHLSAAANVAAAVRGLPRSRRRARALELLRLVNMEGLEQRLPSALSGGQRQRVAFARALARDPAVLLLDEPFSAVDQMTRTRLRRELAQIRQGLQVPLILVTHDLDEAQLLADRLSLLHHGRTVQTGPTAEVIARPVSAEAARLLDHRNLFEGRIERHEPARDRTWLQWAGATLECRHAAGFREGEPVAWLVPRSGIIMHRRDRPSRGERENPVHGTVSEMVLLGDDALVTLAVAGAEQPLTFEVSIHVARRNQVATGAAATISVLADAIHLMPLGR